MKIRTALFTLASTVAIGLPYAQQPVPSIAAVNTPCNDGPKMVGSVPDTVVSPLDSEGFKSVFNGKDLTGWWENCRVHAQGDANGAFWFADPAQNILFSRQKEGGVGGLLMTNQSFDHYELVFDIWPIYGNDGGIFNRSTLNGKTWQTTLDYISGSGVAGSFNEAGWSTSNFNDDPFKFGGAGPSNPEITSWTTFTASQSPTSFGCSSGGCIGTDFPKVWNVDGWNQIRIKFYDGLVSGREVRMETFLRKLQAPEVPWVPVYKSQKAVPTPAGPFAFQIHAGGRWKVGSYNAYRNIKIRKLNIDGTVPTVSLNAKPKATGMVQPSLKINGGTLHGEIEHDMDIEIKNIRGQTVERFRAKAGKLDHSLAADARGLLILELRSEIGKTSMRMSRI